MHSRNLWLPVIIKIKGKECIQPKTSVKKRQAQLWGKKQPWETYSVEWSKYCVQQLVAHCI